MNNDIDYRNLKYNIISNGEKFEFTESEDPLVFLIDIKKGKNIDTRSKEYTKRI